MAAENDIVLIYLEDKPFSFARIEDILADAKRDWYHVKLLLLQIPVRIVTWILKNDYINGDEFTMEGRRMRLELIEAPVEEQAADEEEPETENQFLKKENNVVQFKPLK